MARRDGLFLQVPNLPADSAGLEEAERLARVRAKWRGVLAPQSAEETQAAETLMVDDWRRLQTALRLAITAWLQSLTPAQREAMDPRILDRYPAPRPLSEDAAALSLRIELNALLRQAWVGDEITVDDDFRIRLSPRTLEGLLVDQLVDAARTGASFVLCAHCGRPFPAPNNRAVYCSSSCRTLGWRKRKSEAA